MSLELFADISEIESDKLVSKRFGRKKIAMIKHNDNYYAFKNECTHVKVPFDNGTICETTIECPMHGATFDFITGEALKAPAVLPLEIYKTKIEGNSIFIEIDD